MLRATLQEPLPLRAFVPDGRADLVIRATVVDAGGAAVASFSLEHQKVGMYAATWTPAATGHFAAIYEFFEDVGFTIPAPYDRESEEIEVTSERTDIARLLGLAQENTVMDLAQYGTAGRLVAARLRTYDGKVHADAALAASPADFTAGLLFSWAITASYDDAGKTRTLSIGRTL